MGADWTIDEVGDLAGTVAVVTGANSGLGYETTKALRAKGALVVAKAAPAAVPAGLVEPAAAGGGVAAELAASTSTIADLTARNEQLKSALLSVIEKNYDGVVASLVESLL